MKKPNPKMKEMDKYGQIQSMNNTRLFLKVSVALSNKSTNIRRLLTIILLSDPMQMILCLILKSNIFIL